MENKLKRLRIIKEHKYAHNAMSDALYELYSSRWDNFKEKIQSKVESAMPFLIVPTNDYCLSEKRIMIVGQETDSWAGEVYDFPEEQTPCNVLKVYDRFVNRGGYNSPYWDFIRAIKDTAPSNTKFVINNVVKIGKKRGAGCDDYINSLTLEHMNLLSQELEILKPDMILFLTGPNYDHRIEAAFGKIKTEKAEANLSARQLAKLQFSDSGMPPSYRCYHPAYLRRSKNFDRYLDIINDIIKKL
ncbi:MAG: hypothetical protein IJZ49_02755 [Alistipes sp.]|nr:hypothetical protein [Alistipes sp.]